MTDLRIKRAQGGYIIINDTHDGPSDFVYLSVEEVLCHVIQELKGYPSNNRKRRWKITVSTEEETK